MPQVADFFEALTAQRPSLGQEWVSKAVHDSRLAEKDSLFVALKGDRVDGHNYVAQAFRNGARVALVQRDLGSDYNTIDLTLNEQLSEDNHHYPLCIRCENSLQALQDTARFWRRQLNLRVVGITGSVGKTTTKELIYEVLHKGYNTVKSEGNYNNEIGLPLTMIGLDRSHQYAVLEMGFYVPGEIAFLADLAQPQIGVLTTIGLVHAERAGSQEAIFEGKSELVQALPENGVAILNRDDPLVTKMAERTAAKVIFYGVHDAADLRASQIEGLGLQGVRFRMHYRSEDLDIQVPMVGKHSVYTALRATAVGLAAGMDWPQIIEGLQMGIHEIRLATARAENGATLLDDTYNASPDSTLAALNLLEEIPGRHIAVLGDMLELGPYEEQGHRMVGSRAAEIAQILVTVGERAKIIAASAAEAGLLKENIFVYANAEQALNYLRENMTSEDVVLVKGSRAMKMEEIVPQLEAKP